MLDTSVSWALDTSTFKLEEGASIAVSNAHPPAMVGAELNVENRSCHGCFVATKTLALVRAPVGVVQNPRIQEPSLDEK